MAGNARAWRALMKYRDFANRRSRKRSPFLRRQRLHDGVRELFTGGREWLITKSGMGNRREAEAFSPASPATREAARKRSRARSSKRSTKSSAPRSNIECEGEKKSRRPGAQPQNAVDRAVSGDLEAAEILLKIRERAERYGDAGVEQIVISDWMPDYAGQSGEEKARGLERSGRVVTLATRANAAPRE